MACLFDKYPLVPTHYTFDVFMHFETSVVVFRLVIEARQNFCTSFKVISLKSLLNFSLKTTGDIPRAVGAAIVDDEDFVIQSGLFGGIRCGENRCLEGFFLVVGGDDDGEAVFQSFNGSMGEMIIDGGFWMRDGKGRDEKGKPEDVEGRVASVGTRME